MWARGIRSVWQTAPSRFFQAAGRNAFSTGSSRSTTSSTVFRSRTLIVGGVAASIAMLSVYSTPCTLLEAPTSRQGLISDTQRHASTVSIEDMPSISYNVSDENIEGAKEDFIAILGNERVSSDIADRVAHSSTAWSEAPRGPLDRPAFVVCPQSTEEVSQVVKVCHRRRLPIIGYSGGTSLEGTLAAVHGGVCIDFKLMDKVVSLNKDDVDVVVQPGVGYQELNEMLAEENLFFPPDPGPGAMIGGMISQGCSGTNAYRYGTVKDWVLGLTLVLADGTVIKTRGRPRKSSSGYNLTQLIVGSEGTLGLVTEATLKLTSKPQNERVAVAAFPSTHHAVSAAVSIVSSGMPIGAMEMLDEMSMRAVNGGGYCETEYPETPHLFFKFAGSSPAAVAEQIASVQQLAAAAGCASFQASNSDDEASSIWAARKTALWSIIALKSNPTDSMLSSDTAVPIGRLAEAVDAAKRITTESGLMSAYVGHVGDGNFHTAVLYPANDRDRARRAITEIQRQAIRLDGTVTGEHGIGLEFRDMVVEELGDGAVDAMRAVKLALDPLCLLNPDKIFKLRIEEGSQGDQHNRSVVNNN